MLPGILPNPKRLSVKLGSRAPATHFLVVDSCPVTSGLKQEVVEKLRVDLAQNADAKRVDL